MHISKKSFFGIILAFALVIIIGFLLWIYFSPIYSIKPIISYHPSLNSGLNGESITWAPYGEQAIGISGIGVVETHGEQAITPTASIIKIVVALCILNKKPLSINMQGPDIVISSSDVASYLSDLSSGQSVAKVSLGEHISEYQALEALLIASANNMSTTLANWVFGSEANYIKYANLYVKGLGMHSTLITSASGYIPTTTSSPSDLVKLGLYALKNPVISNIVSSYSVTIPVTGLITNYNANLNPKLDSQITGIKTGNTIIGGGSYLYSSKYSGVNIVGIILDAPDLESALSTGPKVIDSFKNDLKIQTIFRSNKPMGYYKTPWDDTIYIYPAKNIQLIFEPNIKYSISYSLQSLNVNSKSTVVGNVYINTPGSKFTYPLHIKNLVSKPSFFWKIHSKVNSLL